MNKITHGQLLDRLTELVTAGTAGQAQFDASGNFEGLTPRACGEHRTVGDYRAWCFDCTEWCYPDAPCVRCGRDSGNTSTDDYRFFIAYIMQSRGWYHAPSYYVDNNP